MRIDEGLDFVAHKTGLLFLTVGITVNIVFVNYHFDGVGPDLLQLFRGNGNVVFQFIHTKKLNGYRVIFTGSDDPQHTAGIVSDPKIFAAPIYIRIQS